MMWFARLRLFGDTVAVNRQGPVTRIIYGAFVCDTEPNAVFLEVGYYDSALATIIFHASRAASSSSSRVPWLSITMSAAARFCSDGI